MSEDYIADARGAVATTLGEKPIKLRLSFGALNAIEAAAGKSFGLVMEDLEVMNISTFQLVISEMAKAGGTPLSEGDWDAVPTPVAAIKSLMPAALAALDDTSAEATDEGKS
ncbi:MAG: hypothetical protein ACFBZ9_03605 [Sphingomonadales bacterium]